MAISADGKLIEEYTEAGRPFVFGEKNLNAQRMVAVDSNGQPITAVRIPIENVGYSTDVKPAGLKSDTFLELDTKNVYIHDGTSWVIRPVVFRDESLNAQRVVAVNSSGQPIPAVRAPVDNIGYSTDSKPAALKGDTFLELDTKDVYIHDGSIWVVL